jgi:hypothetical protein
LSQDGSTLERDKRGEEKKPDADDDNVYRLLRIIVLDGFGMEKGVWRDWVTKVSPSLPDPLKLFRALSLHP